MNEGQQEGQEHFCSWLGPYHPNRDLKIGAVKRIRTPDLLHAMHGGFV
jgi:hypothetical protein